MIWIEDIDKNGQRIFTSEREDGLKFTITKRPYGRLYLVESNDFYEAMACSDLDFCKKWCEDFELCYNCGEHKTDADKLCTGCYFGEAY